MDTKTTTTSACRSSGREFQHEKVANNSHEKPHIIMLLCDDHKRLWRYGLCWTPSFTNPGLDRLARSGRPSLIVFTPGSPVCSPSAGTCLTGRHCCSAMVSTMPMGRLPAEGKSHFRSSLKTMAITPVTLKYFLAAPDLTIRQSARTQRAVMPRHGNENSPMNPLCHRKSCPHLESAARDRPAQRTHRQRPGPRPTSLMGRSLTINSKAVILPSSWIVRSISSQKM